MLIAAAEPHVRVKFVLCRCICRPPTYGRHPREAHTSLTSDRAAFRRTCEGMPSLGGG